MISEVKTLPEHGHLMKAQHIDKTITEDHTWKEYDWPGLGAGRGPKAKTTEIADTGKTDMSAKQEREILKLVTTCLNCKKK